MQNEPLDAVAAQAAHTHLRTKRISHVVGSLPHWDFVRRGDALRALARDELGQLVDEWRAQHDEALAYASRYESEDDRRKSEDFLSSAAVLAGYLAWARWAVEALDRSPNWTRLLVRQGARLELARLALPMQRQRVGGGNTSLGWHPGRDPARESFLSLAPPAAHAA